MSRKRSTPLSSGRVRPGQCSQALRTRILGNVSYFQGLSAQAFAAVDRRFRAFDYPAEAPIYHEDEPARRLFLVAHGRVKLAHHSYAGDMVVLDLLSEGELFGGLAVLGQTRYPQSAYAQTACCVLTIATADFRSLLQAYPDLTLKVLDGVARDLETAHDTIRAISTLPVEARLALMLLRLADRLGETDTDGILIQSPLSQQDLAAMVSTTAETVSRVVSGWRRSGHLETGRQWIRVRDRAALARLADAAEQVY